MHGILAFQIFQMNNRSAIALPRLPVLLFCLGLFWVVGCREKTAPPASGFGEAVKAALQKTDSLPAEQVFEIAQALPSGVAQDSFYHHHFQRLNEHYDIDGTRENLPFYQRLRGGQPGADALLLLRSSELDFINSDFPAMEIKLKKALEISGIQQNTPFYCEVLLYLGSCYHQQSQIENATKTYLQALTLAKVSGNKSMAAQMHKQLGDLYRRTEEPEKALDYVQQALVDYQKLGDSLAESRCHLTLSEIFSQKKDTSAALQNIEKCIEIRKKINEPAELVDAYLTCADILEESKNYPAALKAAEQAAFWQQKTPIKFWESSVAMVLGVCLLKNGKLEAARPQLLFALDAFKKEHVISMQAKTSQSLYELSKKENKTAEALAFLENVQQLKDTLANKEHLKITRELTTKYETAQKEHRILELEQEQRNHRQQRLILILGMFLLAGLALILFFYQKLKNLKTIYQVRKRIADDLHDDVASSLNYLSMLVKSLREKSKSNLEPQETAEKLTQIESVNDEVIGKLSDIVWAIDERSQTVGKLVERMHDYGEDILLQNNVPVHFEIRLDQPEKTASLAVRQHVLLIFKEAVSNIVRHTKSYEAKIQIENRSDKLEIRFENHFAETKKPQFSTGKGLESMAKRAENLGGKLKIEQGEGFFRIKLVIPNIFD